jgi:two-component system nitrate/nitrite response regulator NarL
MDRLALLITHSLARAGLVSLLRSLGLNEIVEGATLEDLIQSAGPAPAIVLVGLSHDRQDLSGVMSAIGEWTPAAKVVFLARELDLKELAGCFAVGASGYLSEDISGEALEKSLALVAAGEKVFPSELASMIVNVLADDFAMCTTAIESRDLSAREMKILRLLVDGRPNKVIANLLNISESTAKLYVRNIMRKLNTSNRTQTALWALRQGIIVDRGEASFYSDPEARVNSGRLLTNAD